MSRRRNDSLAVLEPPRPAAQKKNWRFNFNVRASWLYRTVVIQGCATEAEARAELHRLVDNAIVHIEPER